tara:strand:- start:2056 stop:2772 length:717 start_codon:yes stop_codon:yes gene_type:complete
MKDRDQQLIWEVYANKREEVEELLLREGWYDDAAEWVKKKMDLADLKGAKRVVGTAIGGGVTAAALMLTLLYYFYGENGFTSVTGAPADDDTKKAAAALADSNMTGGHPDVTTVKRVGPYVKGDNVGDYKGGINISGQPDAPAEDLPPTPHTAPGVGGSDEVPGEAEAAAQAMIMDVPEQLQWRVNDLAKKFDNTKSNLTTPRGNIIDEIEMLSKGYPSIQKLVDELRAQNNKFKPGF